MMHTYSFTHPSAGLANGRVQTRRDRQSRAFLVVAKLRERNGEAVYVLCQHSSSVPQVVQFIFIHLRLGQLSGDWDLNLLGLHRSSKLRGREHWVCRDVIFADLFEDLGRLLQNSGHSRDDIPCGRRLHGTVLHGSCCL